MRKGLVKAYEYFEKKIIFAESIPLKIYVVMYPVDTTKPFWNRQGQESWRTTISSCFWVFENAPGLAVRRAEDSQGPRNACGYLGSHSLYISQEGSDCLRIHY